MLVLVSVAVAAKPSEREMEQLRETPTACLMAHQMGLKREHPMGHSRGRSTEPLTGLQMVLETPMESPTGPKTAQKMVL